MIITKLRTLAIITIVGVAVFLSGIGMVRADPIEPSFGSFVNGNGVPTGSVLVINITYKVTNDEDSGNLGYWAHDNYNKNVQVWQAPDGTFYAVVKYFGQWQTFAGALSPREGEEQSKDGSGTFQGGYTATFDAPECTPTSGNIGSFDYGGTEADVLLRTYGAGQTGPNPPPGASYLDEYCPGYSNFEYENWGWTYHYRSQTWNNFDFGTIGDIVIQ